MTAEKKHILVVEDEEDVVELLRYNLTREGYSVATALLWTWFRGTDKTAPKETVPVPIPTEAPALLDHA